MTATGTPFFSIVIPLFNKAPHIDATLASIAAQTFEDYEILVVDDGSTDGGPMRVAAASVPIELIRQPNAGPGAARNRGIDHARGPWTAFIDADDLWRPDHLQTLADTIYACPQAGVVATGFERDNAARSLGSDEPTPRYVDFFHAPNLIWTSAVAVRTSVLREERFGTAWPGEDVDLWIRLALHHRFAIHPARTAIYVQQTGGAMDTHGATDQVCAIDRQPVFTAIAAALADPALADRHAELASLRKRLLTDYTRPSLFNGQTARARAYMAELRRVGGQPKLTYVMLATLPASVLRRSMTVYARLKRMVRRIRPHSRRAG